MIRSNRLTPHGYSPHSFEKEIHPIMRVDLSFGRSRWSECAYTYKRSLPLLMAVFFFQNKVKTHTFFFQMHLL